MDDGWLILCEFVVPFAGAWIEILIMDGRFCVIVSFPSRERGLKFELPCPVDNAIQSFPSRERGLKSYLEKNAGRPYMSFPSRERGLKSQKHVC